MSEKVKDPVCGMEIEKDTAKASSLHMDKTIYFCSNFCKEEFDREPLKYMPEKDSHNKWYNKIKK